MPKPTFFNLPEAKRERIFQAALEEFAAHPYPQASLNRIVARAGIPKGSLYQYFSGKEDLFRYCLERLGQEKARYLLPVLAQAEDLSFFHLLGALYREGFRFAKEHPRYAALGQQLLAAKSHPLVAQILEESEKSGEAFFGPLWAKAATRGEVRPDIPPAFMARFLTRLNTWLVEFALSLPEAEVEGWMESLVEPLLDALRRGLASGR